jgi:hypothetical protein
MNERERWIVYPLLFFALGASLRDKFLQHVSTKELECQRLVVKQISCEELVVTDPMKPDRIVAKLTSGSPAGGGEKADRYGVLVLIDSEGKELCGVTNNQLQVGQISSDQVLSKVIGVVDPQNPQQRLALLTSVTATAPDRSSRRIGSLLLTDNTGAELFGLVNDRLQMRGIVCQSVAVVDPENPRDVLAGLGSAMLPPNGGGGAPQRIGILELNKRQFSGVRGNAVEAPIESPAPPEPAAETESDTAPPASDENAEKPE